MTPEPSQLNDPDRTERVSTPPERGMTPIAPAERIAAIDVLRGFALLGICVINVPGFFVPWGLEAAGARLDTSLLDRVVEWLVEFFGSGKFNSIFSFLFGVGFAIQLDRAAQRSASFDRVYLRRLAVLLLFGLFHLVFLWDGDVLHIYALLGVPLLLLRRVPSRWLWVLAGLLLLAPVMHTIYEFSAQTRNSRTPEQLQVRGEEQLRIYGKGSFDAMLASLAEELPATPSFPVVGSGRYLPTIPDRLTEIRDGYLKHGVWWFWPTLATTMLAGFIIGRRRVFQNLDQWLPTIRRITLVCGVLGFGMAAVFASAGVLAERNSQTPTVLGTVAGVLYQLGRPVLCACYIGGIVLLTRRPAWGRVCGWLAAAGRMPLTNYLMQSVVHAIVFYGYGLGLYARVGVATGTAIALLTFAAEVAWSNLWLRHFAYGPAEWLWRALTYGKFPRLRTAAGENTAPAAA